MHIIFIILLIFSVFELKYYEYSIYKTYQKKIFITTIILLISFAGFKEIGTDNDSQMYQVLFDKVGKLSYVDILLHNPYRVKEVGYLLLNKVFTSMGFRIFLIFCMIVSIGIKAYFLYRFTRLPFVTVFVYFILFFHLREYTQIRDALATSFILLCLLTYIKKKYLYSILFLIIAVSFHHLAVICIGIILLWELYKAKSVFFYICCILIVGLKIYMPNLDYLSNPLLPSQITVYITEKNYRNFNSGYFLPVFSLFLLILFSINKISIKSNFLYFIFLLTFISYVYSLHNMVLIRIPNILFFGNIIAIGNTKYINKNLLWLILVILSTYWLKIHFTYLL